MANPLFRASRTNKTTAPSASINDATKGYHQGYNKFDYNREHYTTLSFGDVTPFEVVETLGDDKLRFGSSHSLRTYTLSSPMFEDVFMKKSYFFVDNEALLPRNWDKVFKQPAVGDDIPDDDVNTYTSEFFLHLGAMIKTYATNEDTYIESLYLKLRLLFLIEKVFTSGSLPARLGYHFSELYNFNDSDGNIITSDRFFENFYTELVALFNNFSSFTFSDADGNSINGKYNGIQKVELLRDFYFIITGGSSEGITSLLALLNKYLRLITYDAYDIVDYFPFNFGRLLAYQLAYVEYFSNDKVDDIYTSELFLQNAEALYYFYYAQYSTQLDTFLYNGVRTYYDVYSGHRVNNVMSVLDGALSTNGGQMKFLSPFIYIEQLFSINKSLRYGDYFLGARTTPYADTEMTADVVNGSVSAIDTTRSILMQRFSNAVSRTGRRMEEYLGDVVDGYDVPDVTVPSWLATKTTRVDGFEVENTTSQSQGNIVTLLRSTNTDYVYELECGRPGYVIGVAFFEMKRSYSNTVDRFCFHKDRFDMFNKFLQYAGDQPIFKFELNPSTSEVPYAYQLRHIEYKERYGINSGAWSEFLPAMFMIAEKQNNLDVNTDEEFVLNPFVIRAKNFDFDDFYSSLTNKSMTGRFHFMVKFTNLCEASRKMARTPSIL